MKKIYTLLVLSFFALGLQAQLTIPFTFEEGMADTSWTYFANGPDTLVKTLSVVPNPYPIEPNMSDSVLQFIVKDESDTWVGMYTDYVEEMAFSDDSHSISMMVMKETTSPLRIKVERSSTGGEDLSAIVENTYTDDWELLTFDLMAAIPHYYQRLTVFPDFPETRDGGSTIYIDNIGTTQDNTAVFEQNSGHSLEIYPNPVQNRMSLKYPGMTGISVLDIQGKTVKSFKFQITDNKIIELSDLPTGAYIVTAETGEGSYSGSFIKK